MRDKPITAWDNSPLPWTCDRDGTIRDACRCKVGKAHDEHTAQCIVRAVNAYDALIGACRCAIDTITQIVESEVKTSTD
jgi:hypothetical protein